MRTLLHLSDLHFGRVDEALLQPLRCFAERLEPDLVVISGDLTQRARTAQFKQARQFLDSLPQPQIVVPGNHDVPMHNVFSRFATPLRKYRQIICDDLQPAYADEEISVIGINTSRSLTFKNGRINEEQTMRLRDALDTVPSTATKIVVSHHPFDLSEQHDPRELVGRATLAMETFVDCDVDLLLAGHLHTSETGDTSARYPHEEYAALMVQAGTATSTRERGEVNSFNVLNIESAQIIVRRFGWRAASTSFEEVEVTRFEQLGRRWRRVPTVTADP